MSTSVERRFETSLALIGLFLWLSVVPAAFLGMGDVGLVECLFLLSPLVLVPLGFSMRGVLPGGRSSVPYFRVFGWGQGIAALLVAASFFSPRGIPAALMAFPWVLVTSGVGILALRNLWERGWGEASEIALNLAPAFLPIGAGWLLLSRLGVRPMGFSDAIVLLTAVHFHYAGFAATAMVGKLASRWPPGSSISHRALSALCLGVVVGTPLQALGITFSPALSLFATLFLAIVLWGYAAFLVVFCFIQPLKNRAKVLFCVAAFSVSVSMVLACGWGVEAFWSPEVFKTTGTAAPEFLFSLPRMVVTHGVLNSIGFSLCGLVGWSLLEKDENHESCDQDAHQ